MSLTLACISDTHCWGMPLADFPEADILIHSGDATFKGKIQEIKDFGKELSKHLNDSRYHKGYKKIIFVPGNHDFGFESNPIESKKILEDLGITVLINESTEFMGYKFWGSPVTPPFFDWAFNWEDSRRSSLWDTIPDNTDIVITHGPPKGIMDEVYDYRRGGIINTGCSFLSDKIFNLSPKVHVFGHIHEGYGMLSLGRTMYVNASIMSRSYQPINKVSRVVLTV
jgi:Icc-related predicted phosphoesterase